MFDEAVRHWWALTIRGALAIIFGIMAVVWPGLTLVALTIVFGAYALVDGIFSGVAAFRAPAGGRALLAVQAVVSVIFGAIVLAWPEASLVVITILIGVWAIVTGVMQIVTAVQLRKEITGEWFFILTGAVSVLFGVIVAFRPLSGVVAMGILIGICAMIFGAFMIAASLNLRRLAKAGESDGAAAWEAGSLDAHAGFVPPAYEETDARHADGGNPEGPRSTTTTS